MFLTCMELSILEEWSGWVVSLPNLILFEWVPLLSWVPSCSLHGAGCGRGSCSEQKECAVM